MKAHELRLILQYEREPSLRASIRELSRRSGLNYRSAYETVERFFKEDVLSYERHGRVKVCSLGKGEPALAALTEASFARWLALLGKGPLASGAPHPTKDALLGVGEAIAGEHSILAALALWKVGEMLPTDAFSVGIVVHPGNRRQTASRIERRMRKMAEPLWFRVLTPDEMHGALEGHEWLVIRGHERFWRIWRSP